MSREIAQKILVDNMSDITAKHIAKIRFLEAWIIDSMVEYHEKLTNPKPLDIVLENWDYQCSGGCCYDYGETISLNGKVCGNEYAGDDVMQALTFILTELDLEFSINRE